ncbi:DUF494 domain-containing protein [bacterium]|nr:DUF494 domain-containing protein [bacterium]
MNTRVMDVVGFIGQYFSEYEEDSFEQDELNDALVDQGFSTGEIKEAFRWIEEKTLAEGLSKKPMLETQLSPSLRVLSKIEAMRITPEAHGVLIGLHGRGVIDQLIVDEIIDRAMALSGPEVGPRTIRRIAALTVFVRMQNEWREWLQLNTTVLQ